MKNTSVTYHVTRETAQNTVDLIQTLIDNYFVILTDMLYYLLECDLDRGVITNTRQVTVKRFLGFPVEKRESPRELNSAMAYWAFIPHSDGYNPDDIFEPLSAYEKVATIQRNHPAGKQIMDFLCLVDDRILHSNIDDTFITLKAALNVASDADIPVNARQLKAIHVVVDEAPACIQAQKGYIDQQITNVGKLMTRNDIQVNLGFK